jgi:superfamily II DNA/RNA helicase
MTCALQNMRMSCDSTYLVDKETDHGVKADELAALLADLFADPDAKAVVFSQWTRTHDIVIRRLEAHGIGYVSFHGGVPSENRPALVQRFRDDPACRVFLSTDAGSTGLNLQHASTLINMDLPWNPAVLEQRAGRIHRLGQKRPVRIVNFVAKGTIEEGMLSVLAFKRSLSAGILDGGGSEISLGGSRLNRFMKEVESVTGQMGEGTAVTPDEELASAATSSGEAAATSAPSSAPSAVDHDDAPTAPSDAAIAENGSGTDPWAALMHIGAQVITAFASTSRADAPTHPWIERDPATGGQSLRVPLPPPEIARQLADALSVLADRLRGSGV